MLADGSQGEPGHKKITGLAMGHYLVLNGDDNKWYTIVTNGTGLVALGAGGEGVLSAANITATLNAGAIQSGGTTITGLTNGVEYDVYVYFGSVSDGSALPSLGNNSLNAVANLTALTTGNQTFALSSGADNLSYCS